MHGVDVGVVLVQVGKSELHGLDAGVHGLHIVHRVSADAMRVEHAQRHQCGNALAVGRQLVHRPPSIRGRERRHPLGVVGLEVFGGERATVLRRAVDDSLRDRATVEGVAAVGGDHPVVHRQVRISEHLPDSRCPAARQVDAR